MKHIYVRSCGSSELDMKKYKFIQFQIDQGILYAIVELENNGLITKISDIYHSFYVKEGE
jgi:hypothetical protein